jgi:signal transduction histidine kinase
MELLEKITEIDPNIISVVITGYATIESAVEAMKRNAYDFIPKPFTPDQLRIVIKRGLERRAFAIESARLRHEKEMMKKNFVTLVTHQLRSPLASIRHSFGAIKEGFVGDVTDTQKELMEKATRRLDELMQLINDWLDISRIDSGQISEQFEPVTLTPVLSEVMELVKPLAEAGKVNLDLKLSQDLPTVNGHREGLKQAFTNLVSNGITYNRKGGTVTVATREQDDNLVIEISDTGIGISKDDLPFIFEEFFRVKTKETSHIGGTGLGLPIAKRIIEAHNGRIQAGSELGKGTTISIFLPKAK